MNFLNFPKTAAEPGASEKPCGRLGKLLGGLGRALSPRERLLGLLRTSWSLLGRSWRPLGELLEAFWGLLGYSWTLLGRVGGDPKQDKNNMPKESNFASHPRNFLTPFWEAKIDQNGIQNETRFKTIFKSETVALQDAFGAILGRS